MICPLCESESSLFNKDKRRHYYQCSQCTFVFVPSEEFVSKEDESARYKTHNNSKDDPVYRQYLLNVRDSFLEMKPHGLTGVDIGCGESTLLAEFFAEKGYEMQSYDPLFFPDENWKRAKYDFFTMSEVIEHLHEPLKIISSLKELLLLDGKILVKTEFLPAPEIRKFNEWYYKNDSTHVHFYNEKSALELSQRVSMKLEFSPSHRGVFSLSLD